MLYAGATSTSQELLKSRFSQEVTSGQAFGSLSDPRYHVFLAHLRLIGVLIVYPWSGVCLASDRPSFTISNIFSSETAWPIKAKLGRGNERLFTASWSHDQDGRHAHIW